MEKIGKEDTSICSDEWEMMHRDEWIDFFRSSYLSREEARMNKLKQSCLEENDSIRNDQTTMMFQFQIYSVDYRSRDLFVCKREPDRH